jgi:hypothetical protein
MKLYNVITTVREFSGCRNVPFWWFRHEMPQGKRPYADLVNGYVPGNQYAEELIEELFTEDEARLLKAYLDEHHGHEGETLIKERPLPVPNNCYGLGCRAVGGEDDFFELNREPEYSLPFKVWGYFNLLGCTQIDNGDTYRKKYLLAEPMPMADGSSTGKPTWRPPFVNGSRSKATVRSHDRAMAVSKRRRQDDFTGFPQRIRQGRAGRLS